MPTYDFKDKKTGEIEEYMMSYTKLDEFKADNPHLQQYITVAKHNLISGKEGSMLNKAGDGWKEVQDRIKSGMPPRLRGNIKTK